VIFGVMVPLYPNFLILGLIGIAMMIVRGFLGAPDRATYAAHAAIVVVVAAVVSAWYLGPLIASYLGGHSEVVADLFRSGALTEAQFLLFRSKSAFIGTLQVLGVVGILVFWRACWWAAPLGLLAAGILVMKAVMLLRYTFPPGHSFMLLYTPYVLGYLFAAAGLLTFGEVVRRAWPRVVAHTGASSRIGAVVGVAALCAVFAAPTYMVAWAVRPLGVADTYGVDRNAAPESTAALAHAEYLPNLDRPRYPWRKMATGFPTTAVDTAIRTTSATPDPVVLSGDQRLFAFHWYPNWLPPSRTSSNALTQWDSRFAWLKMASRTTDSAALASALGNTPYGPIDVLVLQRTDKGYRAGHITFTESALTGSGFIATEGLPLDWAVFVRR
jgi:hypothetical protein